MYNYNNQLTEYEDKKVRLPQWKKDDLYASREANRNRLKKNLPDKIRINDKHFIEQGSMAANLIVQEKDSDYDIDDGVWFYAEDLVNDDGTKMTALQTQKMVLAAIKKNHTFNKEPEIRSNAIRVYYEEGYHVDIPCYRKFDEGKNTERQELAGENGWVASNPTEINVWILDRVKELNKVREEAGSQFRRCTRLLKRFARSRGKKWDMPNGLKLTMLVEEKFPTTYLRDDEAFYWLLSKLKTRLATSLEVENRAQTKVPRDKLTKGAEDANMLELRKRIGEALEKLAVLHNYNCTKKSAREAWDWVFQTDGFFDSYDKEDDANDETRGIVSVVPSEAATKTQSKFG